MTKMTPEGRALLEHVLRHMEERPDLVDMDTWADSCNTKQGASFCGTTACIAGNICISAGIPAKVLADTSWGITKEMCEKYLDHGYTKFFPPAGIEFDAGDLSRSILYGISNHHGSMLRTLFFTENWPEPFNSQRATLEREIGSKFEHLKKADRTKFGLLAIERLKHFIHTGE